MAARRGITFEGLPVTEPEPKAEPLDDPAARIQARPGWGPPGGGYYYGPAWADATLVNLDETLPPAPPRPRNRQRPGTSTVYGGGLTCPGYGDVVLFAVQRDADVDVTTFGSGRRQYIAGLAPASARLELRGGPMPQLDETLTVRRGEQLGFSGRVREVMVRLDGGPGATGMVYEVVLYEER